MGIGAFLLARPGPSRLDRRGRRDALLLGLPNTALFFGLWFVAAGQILPGEAAVIVYTFPLWVALLSSLGRHAPRPMPATLLAVALGFAGVVLLSEPWTSGLAGLPPVAVTELLAGALSWAVGTVLVQRRFAGPELSEVNGFQLAGGAAALLIASAVFEPNQLPHVSWALAGTWLWLGLIGTSFAYGAWFWLLGRIPATRLSAYAFLVPVVALLASSVVFSERLAPVQLLGVGLVLVCLYAVGRSSSESRDHGP
jgi:drug/metabolite transporter (DMT)-like permease